MKKSVSGVAALVVSAGLLLGVVAPANAATSTATRGSQSLSAADPTLYLKYPNGHPSYTMEIYAVVIGNANAKYSIKLYNASNQLLWSASDQTKRDYYIGTNVTRIEITPNNKTNGESVQWWAR